MLEGTQNACFEALEIFGAQAKGEDSNLEDADEGREARVGLQAPKHTDEAPLITKKEARVQEICRKV